MATSPIYSWPEPDNTDLVKNGALAIRTLGNAIDTTMGTMVPKTIVDAKGDLIAGTAADTAARLAVGNNGETLVADSSTATGLKWATPATTLIKRASFTSVANTGTTFDGVFTSSYKSYQVVFEIFGALTAADDLHFQYRYAGPTTQAADYYGNNVGYVFSSTTITNTNASATAQALLSTNCGGVGRGGGTFFVTGVGISAWPQILGNYIEAENAVSSNSLYTNVTARTYTGFLLKSSSSNITGTVAVYGLA